MSWHKRTALDCVCKPVCAVCCVFMARPSMDSLLRQRRGRADNKLIAVDVQRRGGLHLDGVVACSQHSNGTMWASSSTHHKACLTTVMYSCSAHP